MIQRLHARVLLLSYRNLTFPVASRKASRARPVDRSKYQRPSARVSCGSEDERCRGQEILNSYFISLHALDITWYRRSLSCHTTHNSTFFSQPASSRLLLAAGSTLLSAAPSSSIYSSSSMILLFPLSRRTPTSTSAPPLPSSALKSLS